MVLHSSRSLPPPTSGGGSSEIRYHGMHRWIFLSAALFCISTTRMPSHTNSRGAGWAIFMGTSLSTLICMVLLPVEEEDTTFAYVVIIMLLFEWGVLFWRILLCYDIQHYMYCKCACSCTQPVHAIAAAVGASLLFHEEGLPVLQT